MSHILALKLNCQCGGTNSPMDSLVKPITQELSCMQKFFKKVRHQQIAELYHKESEMYEAELRAWNPTIWHEVGYRYCK
ncbi:uncharacterized protein LOC108039489 [Drosophila rhopaloa]|uniref:Uncharacterized protein LOC108039489 n=1 Tax=Drosophila rhopaloa TaxID=1041015 RepID=A0A6P4E1Z5_DRORH|nr:uncharacterized protein LOC108039489 [Drosophila rhopaloa]